MARKANEAQMKNYIYPLSFDSFGEEEKHAVVEVLDSGKYTMGEKTRQFESEFANFVGAKHAVMVNSGSSANLLLINSLLIRAIDVAQLKVGDEVLVPALSWPTTVWPITQLGLVPVFVDVDPKTMALSVSSAKKVLSHKTKAMFLIHVMGLPANMEEIKNFCKEHDLKLLEDCCESLGCYYNKTHVGNEGWGASFSHFFSHHLTTIEGGTLITQDEGLANDLRSLRSHGWIRDRSDKESLEFNENIDPRFCFISTGYNVRPMELQAAIGLVQLRKLEDSLKARSDFYKKAMSLVKENCDFLYVFGEEHRTSAHPLCPMNICLRNNNKKLNAKKIQILFEEFGIETRPIIAGNLTAHPAVNKINYRRAKDLQVADDLFANGFMIGCHPLSGDKSLEALDKVTRKVAKI